MESVSAALLPEFDVSGFPPGTLWLLESKYTRSYYVRSFLRQNVFCVFVELHAAWWGAEEWERRGWSG